MDLNDLTQKVNMICDKMSTLNELSKKVSTFDGTVHNFVKTVEKVSNFINEKFEDTKKGYVRCQRCMCGNSRGF